jgi:hypothetical protein
MVNLMPSTRANRTMGLSTINGQVATQKGWMRRTSSTMPCLTDEKTRATIKSQHGVLQ